MPLGVGGLFAEAFGPDAFAGEDDDHGTAADFAVVVDFGGHFVGGWDGDFEGFEAGGAGDFREVHGVGGSELEAEDAEDAGGGAEGFEEGEGWF